MKAQGKKLLVEVKKKKDLIGQTEKPKTAEGTIISMGPECDLTAKEGDTVVFSGYAGIPFDRNGTDYMLLNRDEIYLTL